MSNFFSELQRRNVLRVVAAYALVAWIIIEAGSVLLPTFGATTGTFQIYVIVVLVGFAVSLLAWVFEITPEGIRFDSDVERTPEQTAKSRRFMNFAIIGLLVVALVVSLTFNVADLREQAPLTALTPVTRNSIAVLPFTSRSTDPENVLFADGIHDDLLTKLANTRELRVISRTSVLQYRDTTKNLREIGEELGVDTLLEGAVQKVGQNVRINVQLIDAATDEHLWADTYDQQLTMQNIFSIQSKISAAITLALQATLGPGGDADTPDIPTDDLRAYRLYTSGRDNLYLRRLETLREAREQFEQAIELDPDYAEAHVGLAESVLLLSINHFDLRPDEARRVAQDHLDTALELKPELADAYATLGLLKADVWFQTRIGDENLDAAAAFERAISLNPNHAQAYMWFASLRDQELRLEDSIAFYHRSLQLDPLARVPLSNLPKLYAHLGRNEVALKLWLDAIEIHPEWPTPYQNVAGHLLKLGRLDEALAWSRTARSLSADPAFAGKIGPGVYLQFREWDKAHALLDDIPGDSPIAQYVPAFRRLIDGDFDAALGLFSDGIDGNDQAPPFILELAADIALVAGDLPRAREYILRREPLLDSDTDVPIDRLTVGRVVRLAYIHRQTGEDRRADELLNASLAVVRSLPRLGVSGHGILDAQIYALLDRNEEAFVALNEAIDEGYRGSISFDHWLLEDDPFLRTIRTDARFGEMLQRLLALNEVMHERLAQAEQSGNWERLMALAGDTIYGAE